MEQNTDTQISESEAPSVQTMIEIRATMDLARRWDITGREAEQYLENTGYMESL